jgi:prophage DNA circulation protein
MVMREDRLAIIGVVILFSFLISFPFVLFTSKVDTEVDANTQEIKAQAQEIKAAKEAAKRNFEAEFMRDQAGAIKKTAATLRDQARELVEVTKTTDGKKVTIVIGGDGVSPWRQIGAALGDAALLYSVTTLESSSLTSQAPSTVESTGDSQGPPAADTSAVRSEVSSDEDGSTWNDNW